MGWDACQGMDGTWRGSALDCAARACRRECGWDIPPGDEGVWLLTLVPVEGFGDDEYPWS